MCPNTKAFFGQTTPKDCAACNAFMTDLSLIAQYDPSHFKVGNHYCVFFLAARFFSKSLELSALKSVLNWVDLKQKSVLEKLRISKKMFVTLSLVLIPNKSAKLLCSVNKFIISNVEFSIVFSDFFQFFAPFCKLKTKTFN